MTRGNPMSDLFASDLPVGTTITETRRYVKAGDDAWEERGAYWIRVVYDPDIDQMIRDGVAEVTGNE